MKFQVLALSLVEHGASAGFGGHDMNKRGEGTAGKSLEGCEETFDSMDRVLLVVRGSSVCPLVE